MKRQFWNLGFLVITCLLAVGLITSCKKSNNTLPKIGPYDNSDQVASSNLLAHWTFDNTYNEVKSNTAPTKSVGASFTSGVKGQALALNNGYLLYPTIPALSSANALSGGVTVSLWVKVDNNGTTASSFFALTGATGTQTDWNQGPLNVYAETGHSTAYDDTLVLHSAFHTYANGNYNIGGDNINDFGTRGTDFQTVLGAKKWIHYVMRYDPSGSNIDLFANGVRVSNNNFRTRQVGNPPVGIGPIVINPPTQVLIGGWPNATTGYNLSPVQPFEGLLTGDIDEIRVYNIPLQDSDIGYLYQLELAGR
jgi:Concanavalin A-like lectin/glucanases superfamily